MVNLIVNAVKTLLSVCQQKKLDIKIFGTTRIERRSNWGHPVGVKAPWDGKKVFKWKTLDMENSRLLDLLRNDRNTMPAIVPSSVGCYVVDVDTDTEDDHSAALDLVNEKFDATPPLASIPSGKPLHCHIWYRAHRTVIDFSGSNAKWKYGDTRCSHGYVCLHTPEAVEQLASALSKTDSDSKTTINQEQVGNLIGPEVETEKDGEVDAETDIRTDVNNSAEVTSDTVDSTLTVTDGEVNDPVYKVGNRNNTLNKEVFVAVLNNDSEAKQRAIKNAHKAGLPSSEINNTVTSATKAAQKKRAQNILPSAVANRKPGGTARKKKKYVEKDGDVPNCGRYSIMLEKSLKKIGCRLRYNMFAEADELWQDDGSVQLVGEDEDKLYGRLERNVDFIKIGEKGEEQERKPFYMSQLNFRRARSSLAKENAYDPAKDYIEGLTATAEKPLCPLWTFFDVDPRTPISDLNLYRQFCEEAFWATMRGLVRRNYYTGFNQNQERTHHTLLVLVGPQSIFKSTFLASLVPHRNWFGEGLCLIKPDKREVMQMWGHMLYEAPEMAMGKSDNSRAKGFITQDYDDVDKKYMPMGRYVRRCVICATTNDDESLPNDPTGNRRYLVLKLIAKDKPGGGRWTRKEVFTEFDTIRNGIWSYAKHQALVENITSELPHELMETAAEIAEISRTKDVTMEDGIKELFVEFLFKEGLNGNTIGDYMKVGAYENRLPFAMNPKNPINFKYCSFVNYAMREVNCVRNDYHFLFPQKLSATSVWRKIVHDYQLILRRGAGGLTWVTRGC